MAIKYVDTVSSGTHLKQIEALIKNESGHMLQLTKDKIKKIIDDNEAVIALNNNIVIGFVKFFINCLDQETGLEILEVGSLVVDGNFRKSGVGKELVMKLVSKIRRRDQKSMLVGVVRKTNVVSYKFLTSIGGKVVAKPKSMILYPLEWSEDMFYIVDLSNID